MALNRDKIRYNYLIFLIELVRDKNTVDATSEYSQQGWCVWVVFMCVVWERGGCAGARGRRGVLLRTPLVNYPLKGAKRALWTLHRKA